MTSEELAGYVDYTQLKAYASWEDLQKLCETAIRCRTASVCIPPSYVRRVKEKYGRELSICTVIGFPLGYQTAAVKQLEAKQAVEDGASEVDMVVNLGDVKNGDFEKVTEEIRMIKQSVGNHTLKVIIETCYLTEEEKVRLCQCVTQAGADFIKTSTGFGTKGAAIEDIELFRTHIGSKVQIKAAGGIRTAEDMEQFIKAGCTRIGSSVLP